MVTCRQFLFKGITEHAELFNFLLGAFLKKKNKYPYSSGIRTEEPFIIKRIGCYA